MACLAVCAADSLFPSPRPTSGLPEFGTIEWHISDMSDVCWGEDGEHRSCEPGEGAFPQAQNLEGYALTRFPSLRSEIDLSPPAGRGKAGNQPGIAKLTFFRYYMGMTVHPRNPLRVIGKFVGLVPQ